ncbi:MAG TPA: response regulator, partial [Polyangiaceae bacterium]|nr:response regulator [Polyangiaceae bacterium]
MADDDALVRGALVRSLTALGYDVTAAANGLEATELLGRGQFEVIVSDIAMPEIDGIQLLKAIRQRDP